MQKLFSKYLLVGVILLSAMSCEDEDFKNDTTLKASNPTISVDAPFGTNVSFVEKDTTFTFTVTLSEPQIVDVAVYVNVGEGTATQGTDFTLGSSRLVIPAWRTSATGSISVADDADVEEVETIVITVGDERTANANVSPVSFTFTVENTDVPPPPAETAEFTVSWAFADPLVAGEDACDNDVDFTFQTQGTEPYEDDLFGYAASSLACPEHGTLTVADMEDGEVYDIWVFFYGGVDFGDISAVTVTIDFSREFSDFEGSIVIEDVFDSRDEAGALIGTIERNGDVLTIKDAEGEVLAEGRARGITKIHGIKKPF